MACHLKDSESSEFSDSSETSGSLVYGFINTKLLVTLPLDYIQDTFNHTDLLSFFNNFDAVYRCLVYAYQADMSENEDEGLQMEAALLYGLLHARYVTTDAGLSHLKRMFLAKRFGTCIREGCKDCPLLPMGISSVPGISPLGGYCLCCQDVYLPIPTEGDRGDTIDGSFYGRSLPHLLLLRYPELRSKVLSTIGWMQNTDDSTHYTPDELRRDRMRLSGFRIKWDMVD
ncbi:Casein kinase II beta chain [Giardia muris]|uniref:Casein kinase II subunit beta n=1 Tax=Giardia muris TaxID=5742 RepID=A0A4Z1SXZ8_GIAMU|nr:Casein kinase II beta chain [Giardia muris]|eukprot:TNJ30566.1 Casein kinase II beta chain [Giardia muris]